jgi:hypothetical protein
LGQGDAAGVIAMLWLINEGFEQWDRAASQPEEDSLPAELPDRPKSLAEQIWGRGPYDGKATRQRWIDEGRAGNLRR